jgi:hypothetical protein
MFNLAGHLHARAFACQNLTWETNEHCMINTTSDTSNMGYHTNMARGGPTRDRR